MAGWRGAERPRLRPNGAVVSPRGPRGTMAENTASAKVTSALAGRLDCFRGSAPDVTPRGGDASLVRVDDDEGAMR